MRPERLPWLPLNVPELLSRIGHLSTEQIGAYTLLICHYWINELLPKDDRQLAAIVRLPLRRWQTVKDPLAVLFGGDWGSHPQLDAWKDHARQVQLKRRISGSKGGAQASISKVKAAISGSGARRPAIAAPNAVANAPANEDQTVTNIQLQENITSSEQEAARERPATKPPHEISRQELEEGFRQRADASVSRDVS